MKIFISAAEASSDAHAAEFVKAFQKKYPEKKCRFIGIGGEKLRAQGCQTFVDLKELSVMGFSEVVPKFFKIIKIFYFSIKVIQKEKPDAVLILDYPGFHLKLAQKIYRTLGVPLIYYIPPKVWAWKKNRLYKMKKYCDLVLSILPFEAPYYKNAGIPFFYVGNSLLEQLPFSLSPEQARTKLHLNEKETVISVLLGSRLQEVRSHFPIMIQALFLALEKLNQQNKLKGKWTVLFPLPDSLNFAPLQNEFLDFILKNYGLHPLFAQVQFQFIRNQSHICMRASDFGLIKSGTSTLEAGLLGCPHVLFYKVSFLSELLFKFIVRYKKPVGLVNLVLGVEKRENAPFKELLGRKGFTALLISEEIQDLFLNQNRVIFLKGKSEELKRKLIAGEYPSESAAQKIMDFIEIRKLKSSVSRSQPFYMSFFYFIGSFVWSAINNLRRFLIQKKIIPLEKLNVPVISIGNLQAGGAGKTPFVISLARSMVQDGKNVAILTRGYRSGVEKKGEIIEPYQEVKTSEYFGDEPTMIHEAVPQVWLGVGRDRIKLYRLIEKKLQKPLDYILLDDGFQNFKIHKDIEIVLITSLKFYQGFFRDFKSSLHKVHKVFWTKGSIRPFVPYGVPLEDMVYKIKTDSFLPSDIPEGVVLISALADPDSFKRSVKDLGYRIKKHYVFQDHYHYQDQSFVLKIKELLSSGEKFVTTQKDWIKLREFFMEDKKSFIVLDFNIEFDYKKILHEF